MAKWENSAIKSKRKYTTQMEILQNVRTRNLIIFHIFNSNFRTNCSELFTTTKISQNIYVHSANFH